MFQKHKAKKHAEEQAMHMYDARYQPDFYQVHYPPPPPVTWLTIQGPPHLHIVCRQTDTNLILWSLCMFFDLGIFHLPILFGCCPER